MRLDATASDILVVGLTLLLIGGILAMKGVIREEAESLFAHHQRIHATMRRHLPRHGVCPVGVTVMVLGALCLIASYLLRM